MKFGNDCFLILTFIPEGSQAKIKQFASNRVYFLSFIFRIKIEDIFVLN